VLRKTPVIILKKQRMPFEICRVWAMLASKLSHPKPAGCGSSHIRKSPIISWYSIPVTHISAFFSASHCNLDPCSTHAKNIIWYCLATQRYLRYRRSLHLYCSACFPTTSYNFEHTNFELVYSDIFPYTVILINYLLILVLQAAQTGFWRNRCGRHILRQYEEGNNNNENLVS
jgi:hypothetical protein